MELSDSIAIGTLSVAVIACVVAIYSYCTSINMFDIAKSDHAERQKELSLYLIDAYKWKDEEHCFVTFSIRLTNKASCQNGVISIELYLDLLKENRMLSKAKLISNNAINPIKLESAQGVISCPLTLEAKSATIGWVSFEIPKHIVDEFDIDLYTLVATTVDDRPISVDTHLVNMV
ncbi:hypothetical protein K08M3_12830 [Vibrio alginolyticus]|uniref:Uncharacterized protein n=1 Tax=Vibrio alginolyticus TaxID=663 RepID=A0A1W6UJF9_VIBAL|nr:hypothetical protein [Vibrio alginolyticus]ARO98226.1 hypothetical protein K01M1_12810 [Vibrio alginolyticus]ARP02942.1 hypothetical protein K04M1_12920 [Vibrio alginolyticus]ARP07975.1 hypothetical protein K04M3_12590 [Vibrio alginolyticus]ARP13062.1 hypothetical protein K04M5_12600 [Vibrio alginolyticus]ARP18122.1 hypothetical protein K05K4_12840 [Vibrio alginolyticus]